VTNISRIAIVSRALGSVPCTLGASVSMSDDRNPSWFFSAD
jgi:hypothetical protein